ncbi:MAG: hypothetical protein LBC52_06795 [Treponema sp.]|jgi:hypothetical protein|nr:hypothetical protein [Treponema sp.]
MKYLFFLVGLFMPAFLSAQTLFTWDLLWAGSWDESRTLNNMADLRIGFTGPALQIRTQALDRHTMNFELDPVWGDPSKGITGVSFGLYHKTMDSRLLYGVLDEWGLPARIRSPWIRSASYAENHKPLMADLRTTASSTKKDELYLYLSSPQFSLERFGLAPQPSPSGEGSPLDVLLRCYASGQFTPAAENTPAPAFAGGIEAALGKKADLLLEGFYTGFVLSAKEPNTWFSDPPPLPERDFRLGAVALMLNIPWFSITSDWAWSQTFAYGSGVYVNAGLRINPPFLSPWSLSLAADGMNERYTGRDGTNPGSGFRMAGKIERKGTRSSLLRANTSFRGFTIGEPFERSSIDLYYRFPASMPLVKDGEFPLRISRITLNADRNASDLKKIKDGIDGSLSLSLNLPPLLLPRPLLSASASKVKNLKPKIYPLNINLAASIDWLGSAEGQPSPFAFFPPGEFDSRKTSCELLWSPGLFQFKTKLGYTAYAKKDTQWDASISTAVRFKHGRFSIKFAWPDFPEDWNCTLSWRVEK